MEKLVVIVGPTASGKSELGVELAQEFQGEIVSADSRQVYQGLDIGSGKITPEEMQGVPHYMLDVASPKRTYTVSQYQKQARKEIARIIQKGKLPFLVGGSPFYVYAVTEGYSIPSVKPNPALRKRLALYTAKELYQQLELLDPERAHDLAQTAGQADNPRRLIRALEIVKATGKPVPKRTTAPFPYPMLFLGIKHSEKELKQSIAQRLEKRFQHGMIQEVEQLYAGGLSVRRLEDLGLEYRAIVHYLQGKRSLKETKETLRKEIEDFVRRQMTWFKRDSRIRWISTTKEARTLLVQFLEQLA